MSDELDSYRSLRFIAISIAVVSILSNFRSGSLKLEELTS